MLSALSRRLKNITKIIFLLVPLAAYALTEADFRPMREEDLGSTSTLGTDVLHNLINAAQNMGLTTNGNDNRSVLDLFGVYLSISLGFVGITFIVQVIHGGFLWMTAGGNEEQVTKARKKISNGAIGAAVIFFAYILTYFLLKEFTNEAGVPAGFVQ